MNEFSIRSSEWNDICLGGGRTRVLRHKTGHQEAVFQFLAALWFTALAQVVRAASFPARITVVRTHEVPDIFRFTGHFIRKMDKVRDYEKR